MILSFFGCSKKVLAAFKCMPKAEANFSVMPKYVIWQLNIRFFKSVSMTLLGFVTGPVIKANGRLSFEDDLRFGGLERPH